MRIQRTLAGAAVVVAWLTTTAAVGAHGAVPAEPPSAAALALDWTWEPVVLLPLLLIAFGWWRLVAAIDRAHPDTPVPALRRWSFLAGLAVIALALASGIARYDTTLFSVHMAQHLLLTLVAPPLLALGAPITQLLRAASPGTRTRWVLPVLHSRVVSMLGHPVVAWLAFVTVLWATHFSPLFDLALEQPLLHELEHGLYLTTALLFWWPVVAVDPAPRRMGYPARLAYLLLQVPQSSFLAMVLLFAERPLYPHYVTLGAPYGIEALADQRLAAGIMWFAGDLVFLAALLAVLAGWMRAEGRDWAGAARRADAERAAIDRRAAALRERRAAVVAAAAPPPEEADPQPGSGESSSAR